ncbi:Hypothetical_protein [Hexamita inflata]|uniref:Hypothetical_protein n=1 Tax=Hexamita inflata TaxID=28002 RepID=A0AA86UHC4_9EUKA|nr:Hypothetical protein HINF_LOCUS27873 [Hexamita inflata]
MVIYANQIKKLENFRNFLETARVSVFEQGWVVQFEVINSIMGIQYKHNKKEKTIFEKYYMYIIIGGTAAGTTVLCVTNFSIIICRIKRTQLGKNKVKGVTLVF